MYTNRLDKNEIIIRMTLSPQQKEDINAQVALAAKINDLTPTQRAQFLQIQQTSIYDETTKQKNQVYDQTYGELKNAFAAVDSTIMHGIRNEQLNESVNDSLKNVENATNNIQSDKNLAKRKYEMNEWTVNNKRDTLFVFSMLFIMLSGLLLTTGLWKLRIISTSFWALLSVPMIIIFLLTLLYRSQYTNANRNKRYWNKNNFNLKNDKMTIQMPTCDSISAAL